jgi:hypothetical protein
MAAFPVLIIILLLLFKKRCNDNSIRHACQRFAYPKEIPAGCLATGQGREFLFSFKPTPYNWKAFHEFANDPLAPQFIYHPVDYIQHREIQVMTKKVEKAKSKEKDRKIDS